MEQWTNNCIICLLGKSCQLFLWKTLDHSLYSKLLYHSCNNLNNQIENYDDIINMKSNRNTMVLFQYLLSVRWRHILRSMNSSRRFLQRLLSYQLSFQVKNQDVWSNSKRGSISKPLVLYLQRIYVHKVIMSHKSVNSTICLICSWRNGVS